MRSGLLLADAELQRGRHRRATAVRHHIAAIVEAGSDLGRVHLALARAATASGDAFARDLQYRWLEEAREHATEDPLRHAVALQLQVLRAVGTNPGPARAAAFETLRPDAALPLPRRRPLRRHMVPRLSTRLRRIRPAGDPERGEAVARECRRLVLLGYEGGRTSAAAEFWVAMRGPRFRDALAAPAAAGPPEENRYGSASLNNHGAVPPELGTYLPV
ncbi:hypothetical protein [Candidatus Palauibacter sp.]|uniref:hypothetical protein n=1 Tax=Candidatus Palauibacter sp. TaxID=3101350 RepID=UPI003B52E6BF